MRDRGRWDFILFPAALCGSVGLGVLLFWALLTLAPLGGKPFPYGPSVPAFVASLLLSLFVVVGCAITATTRLTEGRWPWEPRS